MGDFSAFQKGISVKRHHARFCAKLITSLLHALVQVFKRKVKLKQILLKSVKFNEIYLFQIFRLDRSRRELGGLTRYETRKQCDLSKVQFKLLLKIVGSPCFAIFGCLDDRA